MPSKPNKSTTDLNAPRFKLLKNSSFQTLEILINRMEADWELVALGVGVEAESGHTEYVAGMRRKHR